MRGGHRRSDASAVATHNPLSVPPIVSDLLRMAKPREGFALLLWLSAPPYPLLTQGSHVCYFPTSSSNLAEECRFTEEVRYVVNRY
jgi:hypothetical protein